MQLYFRRLSLHINCVWPVSLARQLNQLKPGPPIRPLAICLYKLCQLVGLFLSSHVSATVKKTSLEDLVREVSLMNEKFDSLRQDVDLLKEEKRARSRSPVRKSPTPARKAVGPSASYSEAAARRDWADRDPSETIDYNAPLHFSDEDEGDSDQLTEVSDETRKLLTDS